MLIPRFRLRTALIVLTVAAFASILLREAVHGTPWALGAIVGLTSMLLWLVVMAFFFGAAMFFRPRNALLADAEQSASKHSANKHSANKQRAKQAASAEETLATETLTAETLAVETLPATDASSKQQSEVHNG